MSRIAGGFQLPADVDDHDSNSDGDPEPLYDQPPWPYYLIRQDVELEINLLEKSLKGRADITVHALEPNALNEIAIDARQCDIDTEGITIQKYKNGEPLGQPSKASATYKDPHALLQNPKPYRWNAEHASIRRIRVRPLAQTRESDLPADYGKVMGCTPVDGSLRVKVRNEERHAGGQRIIVRKPSTVTDPIAGQKPEDEIWFQVSIPFQTKNISDGLHFVGVDPGDARYTHAYTLHSVEGGTACCIFPCLDDHGSIGEWKISIKCPRTLGDVLHQPLVTQRQHPNGVNRPNGDASIEGRAARHDLSEEDKLLEMTVVCSGILTDEIVDPDDDHKKIMTFESEAATSVQSIGFAVGPFEHVDLFSDFRTEEDDERLGASALKIHGYCLPGRAELVRSTCVALATAADFLSLTFSGYPYDSYKICFVEDMVGDTVPLTSFSFISTRLLHPETIIDTEVEVTRKLVHTLAAQWSGICVVPNTRRDRWVTTGIAYYMTDLFMKKLCGNNEHRFQIKSACDKLVELDVNRPSLVDIGQYLHVGEFEKEFMELKAPLVLFILDKRIAKATSNTHSLTQILSRLFTKAKIEGERTITTKSFRRLCERTSKYTLDTFWEQWVFGSGCPKIRVSHRFNKKRLCVEMTITQYQSPNDALRDIQPSEFLQQIKEKQYKVPHGVTQPLFTGPITIRIHEADGTPYEHIVEIRDDTATGRSVKFDIPYNTKYKRLKRRREKKQATAAGVAERGDGAVGGVEEGFIYCLGDTIHTPADMEKFQAEEYNEITERQMDAESYEWLRVDTDFEWLCSMQVGMAHYMFVSQLQQDRDVVAQEDTMLYIRREAPHPVASTVLARTLMDIKYFHGIRTMAAGLLKYQCNESMGLRGMVQLEMAYRELFCVPGTSTPRPNDFSDKRQYLVQCAIPESLSMVRDKHGKCPLRVKRFLLEIFQENNNDRNDFSDNFFVATLIKAVANTFIVTGKAKQDIVLGFENEDEEQQAVEEEKLLKEALGEINRHLRRDEWAHSYHNVLTIAGLEAKRSLMKAGVIPINALDFVKYLQDTTSDGVRIKCWEALVDLGFMVEPIIFRLFMCSLSTDRSPYVRHQLLKVFCEGLATIAFGEYAKPKNLASRNSASAGGTKEIAADGEGDLEMGDIDSGLEIVGVEASEKVLQEKRDMAERKRNLRAALSALKKEMETTYGEIEKELQTAVWKAIESPVLGRAEKITLLELCATMFDEADRWIISLKLPKRWSVSRSVVRHPSSLIMTFKSFYRSRPIHAEVTMPAAAPPAPAPVAPAPVEPKRPVIVARSSSIKVSRPAGPASTPAAPAPAPTPARVPVPSSAPAPASALTPTQAARPVSERPSISVSAPRADSIVAHSTPTGVPKPAPERKKILTLSTGGSSTIKTPKRPRDKTDGSPTPFPKRPKVSERPHWPPPNQKSRIVTLRHPRLRSILRKASSGTTGSIKVGSTPRPGLSSMMASIQAKPARKPLPSGAPGGSSQSSPAPSGSGAVGASNGVRHGSSASESRTDREGREEKKPRSTIKLKIKRAG